MQESVQQWIQNALNLYNQRLGPELAKKLRNTQKQKNLNLNKVDDSLIVQIIEVYKDGIEATNKKIIFMNYIEQFLKCQLKLSNQKNGPQSNPEVNHIFAESMTKLLCDYFQNIDSDDEKWFLSLFRYHLEFVSRLKLDEQVEKNFYHRIQDLQNQVSKSDFEWQQSLIFVNSKLRINFKNFNYPMAQGDFEIQWVKKYFSDNKLLQQLPKSDAVTLLYFYSRYLIAVSNFQMAENSLTNVLALCNSNIPFRRQIMKFLIPVRIICGSMPTPQLIQKYKLYEYLELCQAVQDGNIFMVNKLLKAYQKLWIKRGIYLLMDKIRILVYRQVCRKVFTAYIQYKEERKINLSYFINAFNYSANNMQVNESNPTYESKEVECILGNLKYFGYAKVQIYESNEQKIILFSKEQPFPKLTSVLKNQSNKLFEI